MASEPVWSVNWQIRTELPDGTARYAYADQTNLPERLPAAALPRVGDRISTMPQETRVRDVRLMYSSPGSYNARNDTGVLGLADVILEVVAMLYADETEDRESDA